jgi:hypothetical protein
VASFLFFWRAASRLCAEGRKPVRETGFFRGRSPEVSITILDPFSKALHEAGKKAIVPWWPHCLARSLNIGVCIFPETSICTVCAS